MKIIFISLFLIPSFCLGDCDVPAALQAVAPGAQWNLRGDTYAGLEWLDAVQVKPTQLQVIQARTDCLSALQARLTLKSQSRLDVKNINLTVAQRLQALLILLDYDK